VFCNRDLNLGSVRAIGFDMDYTLAAYLPAFDLLAFDGAREKLVRTLGYPRKVLEFGYDPERWARGLIVDTARGNFIKVDKHKVRAPPLSPPREPFASAGPLAD
jgi:hypothetical protein